MVLQKLINLWNNWCKSLDYKGELMAKDVEKEKKKEQKMLQPVRTKYRRLLKEEFMAKLLEPRN